MKKYVIKSQSEPANLKIDYKGELNGEQFKAVTESDGPCLVLAGAGSGKTRVLVYRLLYLLEHGVKPNRILLMTFTNKAAKEMMNRAEIMYGSRPKGLWGGTFHSVANRILRIYGKHIGIEPNFTILDEEDAKTLLKTCLSQVSIPQDKYFPKPKIIRKIISLSSNLVVPIKKIIYDRFPQIDKDYVPLVNRIAEIYREKKRQAQSLDYDDLLSEWNRLLVEKKDIQEKLARQFKYILVDEYQDTNHLQGEIVTHLAGGDQNILAVGDDSQSIYSFRGADVNNILNFPKVFANCKTFRLETNYRSTPEILDLANKSIKNNQNQFKKKLKTSKKPGSKPVLVSTDDNHEQAEFVCQRILDLQSEEGMSLNDMAILFRAHFQSLELEMELNKRNIPYAMRGGLRFFEQAHIKDVVAHLKIINNPHDELAWQRVLQLQAGIGQASVNKIWQQISGISNLEDMLSQNLAGALSSRVAGGWQVVNKLLQKLAKIGPDDVGGLIEAILYSGYRDYIKSNFENYQDRISDLEQLVIFASDYESLDKLLADIALSEGFRGETVAGEKDGPDEAIVLSTIHQAKGLEWKTVFVIGLVDGQFPNAKVFENPQDMEEERRLFYVATTRAEDELYLTYPMFGYSSGNMNQMSSFIKELPKSAYQRWQVEGESDLSDLSDGDVEYVSEESDVATEFWARIKKRQNKK